jgi:hypothetical protein
LPKSINLQSSDTLISFTVVSLFTNVLVNEAQTVIRNVLYNDSTLTEWSTLQVNTVMELLDVCLRTTYFQVHAVFYQQKDGMAMIALHPQLSATALYSILKNWL